MRTHNYKKGFCATFCKKQRGAVLILAVFIIGLATTALLIKSFSGASLRAERDEDTMQTLAQAKKALIAWSVSHQTWPGIMPYPDRGTDAGGYDGGSDCFSSGISFNPQFLIGQLPTRVSSDTNCESIVRVSLSHPDDFRDSSGNRLWYAVSRNIVHNYEFLYSTPNSEAKPIINPGMTRSLFSDPPYLRRVNESASVEGTTTYPWLRVFNSQGTLISDRVVAVLIAPGSPISGQDRSAAAPLPPEFLDQVTIAGTTYSNFDYDTDSEDFVMGDSTTNTFNDKLVYITIDELMNALVKRAAAEVRARLITYNTANVRFPDASLLQAPLGSGNYEADSGRDSGTVPVDQTDEVSCTYNFFTDNTTCNVAFSLIGSVSLQRLTGVYTQWDTRTESCTISSATTCTCTGQGSCDTTQSRFSCNSVGSCTMNLSLGATGKFIYTPSSYGGFRAATPNCSMSGNNIECNAGNGTFGIRGLNMPEWFTDNNWQDYFYYHKRIAADLQVGGRTNVEALVIGTGSTITNPPYAASKPAAAQTRPSTVINDYLDSTENADGDLIFDSTITPHAANYNDQSFIVAP